MEIHSSDDIEEGEVLDDEILSPIRKHPSQPAKCSSTRFPNPNELRNSNQMNEETDSDESDKDSDEDVDGPVGSKYRKSASGPTDASSTIVSKKNVWVNVLMDQQVSSIVKESDSLYVEEECVVKRGAETYNITEEPSIIQSALPSALEGDVKPDEYSELWDVTNDIDSLNDRIEEHPEKIGNPRNKKCSIKSRLGRPSRVGKKCDRLPNKKKAKQHVTADDDERTIARHIAQELREEKIVLMERVVRYIGKEKALDLFHKTRDIEAVGGMTTHEGTTPLFDGKSRRLPGGVFLFLLKNDKDITKDTIKEIFALDKEHQRHAKKEIARERRKRKYGGKAASRPKGNAKTELCSSGISAPDYELNENIKEDVDEFDLMEEPDIQIGL